MQAKRFVMVGVCAALASVALGDSVARLGMPFWLNTDFDQLVPSSSTAAMAGDGNGNWIAVWTRKVQLTSGDNDLFYATSADDGLTWFPPMVLNSVDAEGGDQESNLDLAMDASGNAIVVWQRQSTDSSPYGGDWDIFYALGSNYGMTWTDPKVMNPDADTDHLTEYPDEQVQDEDPRIATDKMGNWIVVWIRFQAVFDPEPGTHLWEVKARRSVDNGANWMDIGDPGQTGRTLASSFAPPGEGADINGLDLAADSTGHFIACWGWNPDVSAEITPSDTVIQLRRTDPAGKGIPGETWFAVQALDTPGYKLEWRPAIATDDNGNWAMTWHAQEEAPVCDFDPLFGFSTNDGAMWTTTGTIVMLPAGTGVRRAIAHDALGGWLVVSMISLQTPLDVSIFHTTDDGSSWTTVDTSVLPDQTGIGSFSLATAGETTYLNYGSGVDLPEHPLVAFGGILTVAVSPFALVESAYSVHTHGAAGPFRLLLTGEDNLEPRLPGVVRMEFEMNRAMDDSTVNGDNVEATNSAAELYSGSTMASLVDGLRGPGTKVVVTFDPALDDEECWRVDLTGMEACGSKILRPLVTVRTLRGDVDQDGMVTTGDASQIRFFFNQTANEDNFIYDFDTSGAINTGDFSQLRFFFNNSLRCP